jgi:hypothetical protein
MDYNYGCQPRKVAPVDDTYRLKIKIGMHEFEAEGPVQVVQAQFAAFKELVSALPPAVAVPAASNPSQRQHGEGNNGSGSDNSAQVTKQDIPNVDGKLEKIMTLENRVVSLTVRADSADEAILLLLYGQKILRGNDAVTGAEVMDGIAATGGLAVVRADRFLDKLAKSGDVIVIGEHRSRRYRLTNAGLAKARQSASHKLAIVA